MDRFKFILPKTLRLGKPVISLAVSLLAHIVCLYAFGMFGGFDFGAPVMLPTVVSVDLKDMPGQQESAFDWEGEDDGAPAEAVDARISEEQRAVLTAAEEPSAGLQAPVMPLPDKESTQTVKGVASPVATSESAETKLRRQPPTFELLQPLRMSGEFMATESEKLSYRIYLLGIPVGSAQLEARRDKSEVWITLKVTSDAVISSFYPVDDLIETRHINGNFIMSKIRQKEGSFIGDRGFTIFLRDKSVFWFDRLTRKSVRESIPTSEVVDVLSGLYYLRNRQLQVGASETLHIYDSDSYSAVPVDVLRRETVRLSGFRKVESLLVQPQLKTEGIFRRTGNIHIWLSDDEFRVPVKVETTISLGRVTAELIEAESTL